MADRVEPVLSLGESGGPNKVVIEETFQYTWYLTFFFSFLSSGTLL